MQQALNYYSLGIGIIYRFLLLHVLWLAFTLLGVGILGLFPATYALFKTIKEPKDLNTKEYYDCFFKNYKQSFIKINKAAIIWQVMFFLMGMNLWIFYENNLYAFIAVLAFLLLMLLCVIYFVEYFTVEMPVIKQMKRTLGYVFLYPRNNIILMGVMLILLLAINLSPGITFFFGSSVTAHLIVKVMATKTPLYYPVKE